MVACALIAAPADAKASCHGSFPNFLGYAHYRLDVTVYYHRNMTCGQAVELGQRAYSLPGLHVIRDPYAFGGGGFGGPFRVGHFGCFLTARGSDFREAYCAGRGQAIYFYDHREVVPGMSQALLPAPIAARDRATAMIEKQHSPAPRRRGSFPT